MEKYSVLMSLYKKEHPDYFRQAMDSMINQSVTPDEIVLVEDGPLTEELYAEVKEYEEKFPELLHIVINENNLGLGLALNKGMIACRNDFVARMDTDDISKLDRCEKQLRFLSSHPEVSVLGGQIEEFIDFPNNLIGKRSVPLVDKEIKNYMKRRCPFNHVSVMLKKQDVLESGNYQDWLYNEDYYLWIRMAIAGKSFANLSDTLVLVRTGKDMYKRRGGRAYFRSEIEIQRYMHRERIIDISRLLINEMERFVVQRMMPSTIRAWFFKVFARCKG